MKRRDFVTAMGLLPIAATAACSSTSAGTAASGSRRRHPKNVTVWMYPVIADQAASQTFWADTQKAFAAANPNVNLTIELQPWDGRDEKVATAIASGKGPDLVLLTPDSLPGYVANGGLKSLKGAQDDAFLKGAVTAATVNNEVYAVPLYQTVTTTVYNAKAFADAGITTLPTTWDQVKAAASALASKGVAVLDYSGDPKTTLNLTFYPLLWQAGGRVFAEDGKSVAFNSAQGKAALQFLLDLKAANGLPADFATKTNKVEGGPLTTGKVAMGFALTKAEAQTMAKALGAGNVKAGAPLTGTTQATFGLPGLLARTSISKDDASAVAVAKYLSSSAQELKLYTASGYYPARTDVTLPSPDAFDPAFQDALKVTRAGEVNPKSRQVMAALAPAVQAALLGQKSVDQALSDAERECNTIIKG